MKRSQSISHSVLTVLLLSVFCVGCGRREPIVLEDHDVQFRVASYEPYGDFMEAKIADTEEVIYIDSEPVLTGPDFYEIYPGVNDYGEAYVGFRVWPKAGSRLKIYTKAHVDHALVIMLDGIPVLPMSISSPFGESFIIDSDSRAESFELYELVTGRSMDTVQR